MGVKVLRLNTIYSPIDGTWLLCTDLGQQQIEVWFRTLCRFSLNTFIYELYQ